MHFQAPPKALDEDDVEYYNDLEDRKRKAKESRLAREEEELDKFRCAKSSTSQIANTNIFTAKENGLIYSF